SDPTFRSYVPSQAAAYAASRKGYSNVLYDFIIARHQEHDGGMAFLLDVGCGTGQVARGMASGFDAAMGIDPGEQMIATAKGMGGTTRSGKEVEFRVCAAEDIDKLVMEGVGEGSVNLITAAMAAHWFDMVKFWAAAAKVLKPGGHVAIWTHTSLFVHPSTPNAPAIQRILSHLEDDVLGPYTTPGNQLSRTLYRTLPLPWTPSSPSAPSASDSFNQSSFLRQEWDVDGVLSDGKEFFGGTSESTLASLTAGLGTASMVTRWREAHPELVGTERDCVAEMARALREVMG
ncbi:S-adenosyl-L-methionine-dependent methyltransferase, partial [Mycena galopus ATCC 62051]